MAHHQYSYTDDEIQDTLNEMGFKLPDNEYFEDLKTDVNSGENQVALTVDNMFEYFQRLDQNIEAYAHQPWGASTMTDAETALSKAKNTMLDSVDCMMEIQRIVDDFLPDHISALCHEENQILPDIEFNTNPYKTTTSDLDIQDKENEEPPKVEQPRMPFLKRPTPAHRIVTTEDNERQKINKFLRENCLRRTTPEPGRLPYKVDRVEMMKKYRDEWAKRPHPGEAKRLSLRWKIRNWMARRDIPVVQLQKSQQDEMTRPDWVN